MKLFFCVALAFFGLALVGCTDSDTFEPNGSAGDGSLAGSGAEGGSSGEAGSGSSGKAGSAEAGASGASGAAEGGEGGEAGASASSCDPNPCLNGVCTELGSGAADFSCSCDSGFAGKLCDQVATDACTDNPCLNNGTCKLSATRTAVCTCAAGYGGETCATNIDDCGSNPCQNGGTCVDGVDDFTCTCPVGLTGKTCTSNTDDCAANPCLNGGTCSDLLNDFSCTCAAGYNGKTCSNNIDDCAANPCLNGGTCADKVNDYQCTCAPGYSGKTCSVNIDDCTPSPCFNGGTCSDLVNDFSCACAAGYDGKTCANNVNDCAADPCLNGGSCTDLVNAYSCTCAAGYSGTNCATNIDDCAAAPCLNGGTCVDGVNSFSCTCAAGYSDPLCATFAGATSCTSIKTANPAAADGNYLIDPDGAGPFGALTVWCDMTTDGGGYTSYQIDDGISTSRYDEANSCTALGLQMVIPRTQAHLNALYAKYTSAYFQVVPGVYGVAAGNYTDCAMNSSDATCAANWKALDGGAWFARSVSYSEPNGDYVAGCWLGVGSFDGNGFVFNDANCNYSSGPGYICSDNLK